MTNKTRAGLLALTLSAGAWIGQTTEASAQTVDANPTLGAAATCVGSDAIDSVSYVVDGNPVSSLSAVQQGSTVQANFVVKAGCTVDFGLAAYEAPQATWDPAKANLQELFVSKAGNFGPGAHSLEVTVPDCYYQVDFFTGAVLPQLSATVNYSAQGRLISFTNGGSEACVEGTELTTTTIPTTTTTGDVDSNEVTTTTAAEVLDTTVTTAPGDVAATEDTTTTAPAEVLAENLARTGTNAENLALFAAGLVLIGSAVSGAAYRRRKSAHEAKHFA